MHANVCNWRVMLPRGLFRRSLRTVVSQKKIVMTASPHWRDLNRAMWDEKVPGHLRSEIYDVDGFKAGRLSLQRHEIEDLGDVAGKDLVHLQCHIGLDTLSWARLGARATGLDFSAASVEAAAALAGEVSLSTQFVVADVYDAPRALNAAYDIVYTGVGALCWLPDLDRWAAVVRELLRPGGELYLFEFHPVEWILDGDGQGGVGIAYDYFTPPEGWSGDSVSYADAGSPTLAKATVQWNHPLGEVVTALVAAGLRIESLRELDRSVLRRWDGMELTADGMYRMQPPAPALPLMYVLRARRPG